MNECKVSRAFIYSKRENILLTDVMLCNSNSMQIFVFHCSDDLRRSLIAKQKFLFKFHKVDNYEEMEYE